MLTLLCCSLVDALALVCFGTAVAIGPAPGRTGRPWWALLLAATLLAGAGTIRLALAHETLGAMAAAALALAAASACILLVPGRSDGGWGDGHGDDDDPPTGPEGPIDWDRFEDDFWAHVNGRLARR